MYDATQKNTLLLLFTLFFGSLIFAQNDNRLSLGFAITPKTSYAVHETGYIYGAENRLGFNGQLLINYTVNAQVALATGVKYGTNRYDRLDYTVFYFSGADPTTDSDFYKLATINAITLNYLSIPLEVRYYPRVNTGSRFYAKGGMEYFVKIAEQQEKVAYEYVTPSSPEGYTLLDDLRGSGIAASFGLGLEWSVGNNTVAFLEPEVAYTLTEITESVPELASFANHHRRFDLGLRMGMRF